MTMTDADALEAMLAHHRDLEDGVDWRVAAVDAAVTVGGAHEAAVAELVAYMADEVLPHALAEEQSIYEAARRLPGLAETVTTMVDEHHELVSSLERLARHRDPMEAAEGATAIGTLFRAHVAKENDLLLPALQQAGTPGLAALLGEMHRLIGAAHGGPPSVDGAASVDTGEQVLDVRALAPARRHESIFAAYVALLPGTGFVLVNDHDPRPLRYQFEDEHPGGFTWEYLESGPVEWRVRIGRLAEAPA